jgi:adenine-specific DNA-methyltransferase
VTTSTTRQLTIASERYLARRDAGQRQALGQYLTPRLLREPLLDRIPLRPGMRVLDPGVGTGEFLRSVYERCPEAELVGWDVDHEVLEVARSVVPPADIQHRCALDAAPRGAFDVVVGNPPYFQLKLSAEQRRRFAPVVSGRANIFALFVQVGLEVLRSGGWLGYVIPPSMNNGAYFQGLRDLITSTGRIEHLEVHDDPSLFPGAQTAVQILIVRKGQSSDRHAFDLQAVTGGPVRRTVLCEDPQRLAAAFKGRRTLWDLGYRAVTGSVVWNQNRHRLRTEPGPGTYPLIWAHNIRDGEWSLTPDHPKRPQYVTGGAPLEGPAIVVNRVVGSVGDGRLRCAPIPGGEAFLGENHVNVVVRRGDIAPRIGWGELLDRLRRPGVNEHVVRLTGNTQLSATELTHMLPL